MTATTLVPSAHNAKRRQLFQRAAGLAAAAAIAAPALGQPVQTHKVRFRIEGDTTADWVLSLYSPPILDTPLPPGTAVRFRAQYPKAEGHGNAPSRRILDVLAFLAPAGVPPGVPAPVLAPISSIDIAVEEIVLGSAAFAEPSTRPARNLGVIGRVVANDVESPFGSLVQRVATTTFGFEWTGASDAATFKLVAVNAAGSHLTVVPEAAGEIAFG